jgi:hypothetical protein
MQHIRDVIRVLSRTNLGNILTNIDLFTYIMTFLNKKELKEVAYWFRPWMHKCIVPRYNILLYGQVQSGKTSKILDYIRFYNQTLKILIIQNSKFMLSQYCNTFEKNGIRFLEINSNSSYLVHENVQVLVTIHNKFRMDALDRYIELNRIKDYDIILDESDQYIQSLKYTKLYNYAKVCLHVTATPFRFMKESIEDDNCCSMDRIVKIKPSDLYVGIDKVNMIEVECYKPLRCDSFTYQQYQRKMRIWKNTKQRKIEAIIQNTFGSGGFMLISCFTFKTEMYNCGIQLSTKFPTMNIVVASTDSYTMLNGKITQIRIDNMQTLIDQYNDKSHLIIIANRMANRGINYTNFEYSRPITHQISGSSDDTTFIQKCRIFGNRSDNITPQLHCLVFNSRHYNFINSLKVKIESIADKIEKPKKTSVLNMNQLKQMCRDHQIRGFSKLNKSDLINLLVDNGLL